MRVTSFGLCVIGVLACAASARAQTPYTGTPAAIPGTIQAEDFDNGGQGVAYYDTSYSNSGGQYRSTRVDIATTTDTGGGYNIGYTKAGEWLKYTVAVAQTGTYAVEFRVASKYAGAKLHLEVDGANVTGTITLPVTGGFQTWQTILSQSISLTAGQHVLRVKFDTQTAHGDVGNLNWLRFAQTGGGGGSVVTATTTPFTGTPVQLPGTVQAEDFDNGGEGVAYHDTTSTNSGGQYRSTRVDISATTDTGGGYKIGWFKAGEWLIYTVSVLTNGTYDLSFRMANPQAGGRFHLEVDGVNVTGSLSVPATGRFETFTDVKLLGVGLVAGTHQMRIVGDTNASSGWVADFNWFAVTAGSAPPPSCTYGISPSLANPDENGGTSVVTISTTDGCDWTADSPVSWITVTPAGGSGSGTTSVVVAANTSTSPRSATVTIAGEPFLVSQPAATAACSYSVSPTSLTLPSGGGSASVSVSTTSTCSWSASSSLQWLPVSPSAGAGSASVTITAAPNPTTSTRTGTVSVAGTTVTVTQPGSAPTYLCDQAVVSSATVNVNTPMHMLVCSKDVPSGFKTKISGGGQPDVIVDVGHQTAVGPANSAGAIPYELPITFPTTGTFQASSIAYNTDTSGTASTPSTNAITVTVQ